MNILYTFNITINQGFNKIILPEPILVPQGSLILLTQNDNSVTVAIDSNGNATYSDMVLGSTIWNPLSSTSNWRLYLNALTNFSSYQTSFSISHAYNFIGLYEIALTFLSSNVTFYQTVNITDCKTFKMIDKHFL
jgi:hypothetical protein